MPVRIGCGLPQIFWNVTVTSVFWHLLKIEELEEQCNEINKEKERNAQLSRRLQELETELQDKELVSAINTDRAYIHTFQKLELLLTLGIDLWPGLPTARKGLLSQGVAHF